MTRKTSDAQTPHTLPLWVIWLITVVVVFALSAFGADDCADAPPRIQPTALPEA